MRPRLLAAAATAALVVVAVVAGVLVLGNDHPRKRTDCRAQIFFKKNVSSEQMRVVGRRLSALRDVSVRFLSRKQALAIMRRKYPELVAGLPSNPLPASFAARTTYADSCAELRDALSPRPDGVDKISTRIQPLRKG
jgi:cell division protein FtsX